MKNKITICLVVAVACICASTLTTRAETLSIFDDTFSIISAPTSATVLGARWGLWSGSSFVQAVTSGANLGYVDISSPELSITLNQVDNSVYTVGTQLSVAIYGNNGVSDSQAVNFATAAGLSGFKYAVLTDPSWLVPTFTVSASFVDFNLTASTTAQYGSYSYNGGNQQITTAAVPEPSTYALLAMSGVAFGGYVIRRRRR